MYQVYCNGDLLYSPDVDGYDIFSAKLELEVGKTGAFEFTIYPNHPIYSKINIMLSMIDVFRKNVNIFSGRVYGIEYGFHNEKKVSCEGDLSFFLDSLIEANAYYGSFHDYLRNIVSIHNNQVDDAKKFSVGNITVPDFEGFEVVANDYRTIFDDLNESMVQKSGGYLQTRNVNGVRYLDLLAYGSGAIANQQITLGTNIVSIQRDTDGSGVFSSIIPLGAEVDGKRVDIAPVNDWKLYVSNSNAVAKYGLIHKVVVFEGITDSKKLKTAAEEYLAEYSDEITNMEISVVDLSPANPSLDSFKPGQMVNVYSESHFSVNPSSYFVKKVHIGITNPADTKITVGRIQKGITDSVGGSSSHVQAVADPKPVIDNGGNILWSGVFYMQASQRIELSEPVSKQKNGIVLVFSRYSDGVGQNYNYNHFFVHKAFVATHSGVGSQFLMSSDGLFGVVCSKYIYINDVALTGHANNTATGTANGITYNNSGFVLRYVIGV